MLYDIIYKIKYKDFLIFVILSKKTYNNIMYASERSAMDYIIPAEKDGGSVLDIIRTELGISHSTLRALKFTDGGITLNGEAVTVRKVVKAGDILSLAVEDKETPEKLAPYAVELDIAYEDDELVIPNKPPFMPTHQSHGHFDDTLANALAYKYEKEGKPFVFRPINRLDRNTSGLVIIAKNRLSAAALSESMRRREIRKKYIAILKGELPEDKGVIDACIRRAEDSIIFREVCAPNAEGADTALTEYEVICRKNGYTLVRAEPLTGRTHQLRVHFAHLGAHILGDTLYGEESALIDRHALHAATLTFPHPTDRKTTTVNAPLPEDMARAVSEIFGDIL